MQAHAKITAGHPFDPENEPGKHTLQRDTGVQNLRSALLQTASQDAVRVEGLWEIEMDMTMTG